MSGEITSVQQRAYCCSTKAKQIKKNVFCGCRRDWHRKFISFFSFLFMALRQISAALCFKQMEICFDPAKAEQAKCVQKSCVTPFKKIIIIRGC